jgi:hypothetical protein
LHLSGRKTTLPQWPALPDQGGLSGGEFRGAKRDCAPCHLRSCCLKHPERAKTRQVHFFEGCAQCAPEIYTQKMKRKIDSLFGRFIHSWRLATAEPVFANITRTRGLDRFTLHGRRKVNMQWLLTVSCTTSARSIAMRPGLHSKEPQTIAGNAKTKLGE